MQYSYADVQKYADRFSVPKEDVIYTLLNVSGVAYAEPMPRIRTSMRLNNKDDWFYFGLANNQKSVFSLKDNVLYLNDTPVATAKNVENDDCASSYFRKNKTVLTINSNQRSMCRGCKFCPNNLELNSVDDNLTTEQQLKNYFLNMMNKEQKKDLSFLERITICTGCFRNEKEALTHIINVHNVIKELGFCGQLHYIGSQIQTPQAFQTIKDAVDNFMYTFTIECFSQRDTILRFSKSDITIDKYKELMKKGLDSGFTVNYIYILGVDPLSDFKKYSEELKPYVNYFPSINLFQPHEEHHYQLRDKDAAELDYYLSARRFLEDLYDKTDMKPQSWECYRPLWYYAFSSRENSSVRI